MVKWYAESVVALDEYFHATPLHYYINTIREISTTLYDIQYYCELGDVLISQNPNVLYIQDVVGFTPMHCLGMYILYVIGVYL